MNITKAFQHQIQNTRLLIEDDLKDDNSIFPVVWNGVIFRPSGNYYTSGKEMRIGEKLLVGYVVAEGVKPKVLLLEESELTLYEKELELIRVVDNVPVMQMKG